MLLNRFGANHQVGLKIVDDEEFQLNWAGRPLAARLPFDPQSGFPQCRHHVAVKNFELLPSLTRWDAFKLVVQRLRHEISFGAIIQPSSSVTAAKAGSRQSHLQGIPFLHRECFVLVDM